MYPRSQSSCFCFALNSLSNKRYEVWEEGTISRHIRTQEDTMLDFGATRVMMMHFFVISAIPRRKCPKPPPSPPDIVQPQFPHQPIRAKVMIFMR